MNKYDLAKKAYLNAIKYPAGYSPFVNLGRLEVEKIKGEYEPTKLNLTKALKLFPQNPDLWFLLAEWEDENGHQDLAQKAREKFNQFRLIQ